MDNTLERTLALSGIFQAAHMVQRISQGQSLPNDAFRSMIESLFSLDPETVDDVYPTPSTLSLGYTLLESAFHGSGAEPGQDTNQSGDLNVVPIRPLEQQHHKEQPLSTAYIRQAVRYALAIMYLEQRMKKETDKLSVMRSRLLQCRKQLDFVDSTTDPQIIQSLAQIYLDTAGTLKFRIQVQGQTSALKKSENADKIRAILLAGLRATFLWRQLGGRRWQLLFTRQRIMQQVAQLKTL